jgi:hypothetical protein
VIADNRPKSPQTLALTGFGTYIRLTPATLTFANQKVGTKSTPKQIVLINKGSVAVSISGVSIDGSDPGDFSETNNCGTSVASGASCSILVTFKPVATGSRTAIVEVTDNGGASPQKVTVSGTGT